MPQETIPLSSRKVSDFVIRTNQPWLNTVSAWIIASYPLTPFFWKRSVDAGSGSQDGEKGRASPWCPVENRRIPREQVVDASVHCMKEQMQRSFCRRKKRVNFRLIRQSPDWPWRGLFSHYFPFLLPVGSNRNLSSVPFPFVPSDLSAPCLSGLTTSPAYWRRSWKWKQYASKIW